MHRLSRTLVLLTLVAVGLVGGCRQFAGYASSPDASLPLDVGVIPSWADGTTEGPTDEDLLTTAPPDAQVTDAHGVGPFDLPPARVPADLGNDAEPSPSSTCPNDPTLVGCYRFETGALERDESPTANALTCSGVSSVQGIEGSAVQVDLTSSLLAPDHPALVPAKLTAEVWLKLGAFPPSGRAGVFDKNSAYGFFIKPTGELSCKIVDVEVQSVIPAGTWVHAACTWDGATIELFIDGKLVGSGINTGSLGQDGSPLVIGGDSPGPGERMQGVLDNLRIWNIPRTAAQICAAATLGNKVCP